MMVTMHHFILFFISFFDLFLWFLCFCLNFLYFRSCVVLALNRIFHYYVSHWILKVLCALCFPFIFVFFFSIFFLLAGVYLHLVFTCSFYVVIFLLAFVQLDVKMGKTHHITISELKFTNHCFSNVKCDYVI